MPRLLTTQQTPYIDLSALPLDRIDVSDPRLYQHDCWYPLFERLRKESPVHYCAESAYGPYWSLSRYKDIVECEMDTQTFSSVSNSVQIQDKPPDKRFLNFLGMDPPAHTGQRRVVSPMFAPTGLRAMTELIRERTRRVLDGLPRDREFDWVERVSIELTTMMLATLLDFPFEERNRLTYWSDVAMTNVNAPGALVKSEQERFNVLREMSDYVGQLFSERRKLPPGPNLLSMLAHGGATQDMQPSEFMGTLVLLIVGGNDTTRNSMTGGLLALAEHPDEYRKLQQNHSLVHSLVPEIIRYVTPVIHMRRTAVKDITFGGKQIRAGDKVVMWYISGNRDPDAIERPDEFIIDRERPRQHLAFGYGIHRCLGSGLAELQLRVLWEEILQRFPMIEICGEPKRAYSNFLRGIHSMPVRISW